jgi:hypothetical protein
MEFFKIKSIAYVYLLSATMNRLETYKDFYQKEIERKSQLNNELSIPMGLISLLATGIFFYLTSFDFSCDKILYLLFIALLIIGTFFLIRSIYFLLRSYLLLTRIVKYDYLAYPNDIDDFYQNYKDYQIVLGDAEAEAVEKANEALESYFIEAYLRTTTQNMSINDERSANLFKCKRQILYTLIILLVAFLPYIFNNFTKKERVPKVEISNEIVLNCDSCVSSKIYNMAIPNRDRDSNPPLRPISTPALQPRPVPPTPPADRHVKEGEIPAKPRLTGRGR